MYTIKKSTTSQSGYTLLQICIGLLVLGVLIAPVMNIWSVREKEKRYTETSENIDSAISQLQGFVKRNGYFPCPAPMTADRNIIASGYGAPSDCRNAAFSAVAPGSCLNGICIERSVRTDIANRRVIVGAMPFRVLQMDEQKTYDAYKGRLLYAVTESLTDPATYNETIGGLAIRDEANNSLVHVDGGFADGSGAFIVLSHGPSGVGAYNSSGVLMSPCAGASLDVENCNTGFQTGTATSPDSIYISAFQSNAAGAGFFDDFVNYFSETPEPRWKYNATNDEGIETIPGNLVGVGTAAPAAALEVRSLSSAKDSLRIYGTNGTDGKVLTNQLCNETGTNCFAPSLIGGSPGMTCGAGEYMTGIESGAPRCAPIAVECSGATPVLIGINAVTKTPICSAIPAASCAATPVTICNPNDVSLPLTGSGGLSPNYTLGSCKTVRFKCSAGIWSLISNVGQCTFTPPPSTTTGGLSCGAGYTGTYSTTSTVNCLGATTTTSTFGTDCTCTGSSTPESALCSTLPALLGSPYYIGNATRTRNYTPPSCALSVTAWDTSGCSCGGPIGSTQWVAAGACAAGFAGTITKEQVFDGTICNWKDTGNINNTCACNTTPQTIWQDHVCANPVCETPNPALKDSFTINIDATTCTALAPVPATVGACMALGFTWQEVEDAGTNASSYPASPNFVGDGCSCAEHTASIGGDKKICFYSSDGSKHTYRCKCL